MSATAYSMIEAYWQIGKRIVEQEQLGKGFSSRTLRDYRQFYFTFPIWEDLAHACANLTWSHIRFIMKMYGKKAQQYYLKETAEQNWSVRTLERNIILPLEFCSVPRPTVPLSSIRYLAKINSFLPINICHICQPKKNWQTK